jgi:hypothetical protein
MRHFGRVICRGAAIAAAALALAGCSVGSSGNSGGGFRETLGLVAPPPDPFLTVARAPLQMPQTRALPTPQPGAPSRVEPDPARAAQTALLGAPVPGPAAAPTAGEGALLAAAGADAADPSIRETIVAEAPAPQRRFGLDSIFGIPIVQDPDAEAQRVRAEEEAARLRAMGLSAPTPPAQAQP